MKKGVRSTLGGVLLAAALGFTACNDDDYVYPSVVTEFVEAHVNQTNYVDRITTDAGQTFALTNNISAEELQANSYYRVLCMFEDVSDEMGSLQATAYSIRLVYSAAPVPAEKFQEGIKADPLSMQSIWRGGEYLNMILLPKAQNITHTYCFVEDSVTVDAEGTTRVFLRLYHDRNDDLEAYQQKTYLSVPLRDYTLQEWDSIVFRVNTYEDGWRSWRFAY